MVNAKCIPSIHKIKGICFETYSVQICKTVLLFHTLTRNLYLTHTDRVTI